MRQREEADDSRAHDGAVSHSTVHVEACGLIYPLAYLSQVSRAPKPVALAVLESLHIHTMTHDRLDAAPAGRSRTCVSPGPKRACHLWALFTGGVDGCKYTDGAGVDSQISIPPQDASSLTVR